MGKNRIEQTVDEIFEFIESCKVQPLSNGERVIVVKTELYEYLDELVAEAPDELKRYRKVISNRDAIIADAEKKAAAIVDGAVAQQQSMVGEHEIMRQAYQQANEMIMQAGEEAARLREEAAAEAEQIQKNALDYANELLRTVENSLLISYEGAATKYGELVEILKSNLEVVQANRAELGYGIGYEEEYGYAEPTPDDEYDFSEDTFTKDLD